MGGDILEVILNQRQELKFIMTSELRQAIELLQYSNFELNQYIRKQELENPLIEIEEVNRNELSVDWSNDTYQNSAGSSFPLDTIEVKNENTRDNLLQNAKLIYSDKATQKLLEFLIYSLDDNGYLSFFDIESEYDLIYNKTQIENGIHLLQEVGPVGIGARNLKECLLLQIIYSHPENKLAKSLVQNHLELIADRKWKVISSKLNISMSKVKGICEFILTLNPKPCSFPSNFSTEYLIPDIIVEISDGQFNFRINDGYLPTIRLNSNYAPSLHAKGDLAKYVLTQYQKYRWLLSSIEQRRNTIIKIVQVLLKKQYNFFKYGFQHLNPLTLQDVAEEIGVHQSTVSRAIANKVIQTPYGSFDLRLLFTSKLTTAEGNCVSKTKVKALIQKFILQENKYKPFSDQKIAEYLNNQEGIYISRRTISKYREELKIPSANRRKEILIQFFALGGISFWRINST